MKQPKSPLIDPSRIYVDASEEELLSLWRTWYPGGSGPLSTMRTICALIENIAVLRGFDPSKWTLK